MTTKSTHDCVHETQFLDLEKRLTSNEEKVETILNQTDKLAETLKKLDATQDKLTIQITQLNTTFNILKWLITILIALFGGIFVFLVTELIKLI